MANRDLPIPFLRECFDFDPETGALTWRIRPRSHFPTEHGWVRINARQGGQPAGSNGSSHGYLDVGIGGKKYLVHRIAFALHHGRHPQLVDHVNGNKLDNRAENLREADRSTNGCNRGKQKNNTSGHKGVSVCARSGKFIASIAVRGVKYFLGRFDTKGGAAKAYRKAADRHHRDFARAE